MNLEKQFESEFNRFGLISFLIALVGCLGGLTVGLGAINDLWALTFVVVSTMLTLSLILGVAPMSWIYKSAGVSLTIDILLLAYYLIL